MRLPQFRTENRVLVPKTSRHGHCFSPRIMTTAASTLWYQSGIERRFQQKRWLGLTSIAFWCVTILFCAVCCVVASQSTGWDGLGWVMIAFLGSWIGCGIGVLF